MTLVRRRNPHFRRSSNRLLVELRRFNLVSQVMIVLDCRRIAICGGDTTEDAFRKARVAAEMTLLGMAERKGMEA